MEYESECEKRRTHYAYLLNTARNYLLKAKEFMKRAEKYKNTNNITLDTDTNTGTGSNGIPRYGFYSTPLVPIESKKKRKPRKKTQARKACDKILKKKKARAKRHEMLKQNYRKLQKDLYKEKGDSVYVPSYQSFSPFETNDDEYYAHKGIYNKKRGFW